MKEDEYLQSPFFTIKKNEIYYLNRYKICELSNNEVTNNYIKNAEGIIYKKRKKQKFKNTSLILEPHSDDFALSALAYTYKNTNALVLNVFSKTNPEYFTWNDKFKITNDEYEKIRLEESNFVVEKILNEKFKSIRETSTRITNKSKKEIKQIILDETLKQLKENKDIDRLLIPMGIGMHPDHIIVYEAIINNIEMFSNYKIIFYPEYPYSRCKKSYINRLKKIKNKYDIKPIIIDITDKIETIADCSSAFKSQFDDINKEQMIAIIREDARALATEYNQDNMIMIYYELGGKK